MGGRLVLGCGALGHVIVTELFGQGEPLLVLDADERRIDNLRGDGVAAEVVDPTDPDVLRSFATDFDVVIVAGDDPAENRRIVETVDAVAVGAILVAYTGPDPSDDDRAAIHSIADEVVDHAAAVEWSIRPNYTGATGLRLIGLTSTLRSLDGPLGVFMHDNPDPDAIGSALALRNLARHRGVEAHACYFGEIAHQENRALVNLLDLELISLEADGFDPAAYGGIALVDHARAGVNDQLPSDTAVDIVIDHHPPREPVDASFVDLRSDVGATSTLMTDYIRRLGLEPAPGVATALLFGIRVDTRDFGREITGADFDAAAFLHPRAANDVLERVENPGISGDTFETIARSIRDRRRFDSLIIASAGPINNRDALAQAADHLLGIDGVSTTIVYGITDGAIYLSARSVGSELDIGELLREAFDRIGSAGGHTDMAGAQVPLGILAAVEDTDATALDSVVDDMIVNRVLEVLEESPSPPSAFIPDINDPPDHDLWSDDQSAE